MVVKKTVGNSGINKNNVIKKPKIWNLNQPPTHPKKINLLIEINLILFHNLIQLILFTNSIIPYLS